MKKIINFIKNLFAIDENEIKYKAEIEASKRFNIQRILFNNMYYDVITLDGIPVSRLTKLEEDNLVERLAEYRDMYVKMSVAKKEVL